MSMIKSLLQKIGAVTILGLSTLPLAGWTSSDSIGAAPPAGVQRSETSPSPSPSPKRQPAMPDENRPAKLGYCDPTYCADYNCCAGLPCCPEDGNCLTDPGCNGGGGSM
jgi:hypothetical protein